jgi:hypothetical protein
MLYMERRLCRKAKCSGGLYVPSLGCAECCLCPRCLGRSSPGDGLAAELDPFAHFVSKALVSLPPCKVTLVTVSVPTSNGPTFVQDPLGLRFHSAQLSASALPCTWTVSSLASCFVSCAAAAPSIAIAIQNSAVTRSIVSALVQNMSGRIEAPEVGKVE